MLARTCLSALGEPRDSYGRLVVEVAVVVLPLVGGTLVACGGGEDFQYQFG